MKALDKIVTVSISLFRSSPPCLALHPSPAAARPDYHLHLHTLSLWSRTGLFSYFCRTLSTLLSTAQWSPQTSLASLPSPPHLSETYTQGRDDQVWSPTGCDTWGMEEEQKFGLLERHTQRSLATRGEDWASQGQPKGKAEIPVVTRE